MPIDLGLSRITSLLKHLNNPHINAFKSIHIAGTNGKGSTIAYLSSILTHSKIRNGRFTSPHMLYYNDCISINNEVYPRDKFNKINDFILEQNKILQLGCTEFELLTVTAFKIFELEKIEIAIIEVGLGGRLDATNVLEPFDPKAEYNGGVIATGITKIGFDHENLLGNTLSAIAFEKAGIIKANIPCVVDRSNDDEVLQVIKKKAQSESSQVHLVDGASESIPPPQLPQFQYEIGSEVIKSSPLRGEYQLQNLSIALKIIELLNISKYVNISIDQIKQGISQTSWPGRLQEINIPKLNLSVLLDGAHNESAAIELGKYLDLQRSQNKDNETGIIFIIAMTSGKKIDTVLSPIVHKEKDTIIVTTFTQPEQMPWIHSYDIKYLQNEASQFVNDVDPIIENDISNILTHIVSKYRDNGDKRPVVICGSLYLCGDVLRYVDSPPS
ncbi:folylpolyglutamate synthase [Scheffersomyces coipomensis]|uniref:folylpolyglutamate synthase n=1 Tax=Scheffersomyces coipomensis TaxID=1788519 RepID=UPI00315CAA3C